MRGKIRNSTWHYSLKQTKWVNMPTIDILIVEIGGKIYNEAQYKERFYSKINHSNKQKLVRIDKVEIDFSFDLGETNYELE